MTLALSMPLGDWQFWATSLLAILALAWLLRGIVPIPFLSKARRHARHSRRVNLTIGGKGIEKP
jgi:hypothetical protein